MKETNRTIFLRKVRELNLLFVSQKELEQIIGYYCKTFLGFNDNQIKNVIKAKYNYIDLELLHLINTFIIRNNEIRAKKSLLNNSKNMSSIIFNEMDNKAFSLQKTLIRNQANAKE